MSLFSKLKDLVEPSAKNQTQTKSVSNQSKDHNKSNLTAEEKNGITANHSKNQQNPSTASNAKGETKTQELVLLKLANKFKTTETSFPDYLRSDYGIGFARESYIRLCEKGFVREESASESLAHLKVKELKEIASAHNISPNGKKDQLCSKIQEEVSEEELEKLVSARYWIVTDAGQKELDDNPFISLYTEKHPYNLNQYNITAERLYSLIGRKPESLSTARDRVWGEFNRISIPYYQKAESNHNFHEYSELLRTMALFVEEDEQYQDALNLYCRYLFYVHIDGGIAAIYELQYSKDIKGAADTYFLRTEVLPFMATDVTRISNEAGLDSNDLEQFMLSSFKKEKDKGLLTPEELTEFVMCGLTGKTKGQKDLCLKGVKKAVSR